MPKLFIKSGEKQGQVFIVNQEDFFIGREADNSLALPDRRISRKHVRIFFDGVNYVIEDLGSVNGTVVNNVEVAREVLHFGNEIRLGSTVMQFLSMQAPETLESESAISRVKIIPAGAASAELAVQTRISPEDVQSSQVAMQEADAATLYKAYQRLMILYRVSDEIGHIVELPELLNKILIQAVEVVKAERGVIALFDLETHDLVVRGAYQQKALGGEDDITFSRTIVNEALAKGEAILTVDALADTRFKEAESIVLHGTRSTMCVPVKTKDKVLGVIYVDTKARVVSFMPEDLELLTAVSNQAAVAIVNAQLFDEVKKAGAQLAAQQNQLIEAEKLTALGRLAGGVAHEINNPMTSILGFSQLLSEKLGEEAMGPEELKECRHQAEIVVAESNRCIGIVQTLLQFARRTKGELRLTDINKVVEDSLKVAHFHLYKVHIDIQKELGAGLPSVMADANQLQQVFLNMIVNAKDAMGDTGRLTITTSQEDKWLIVKFSDTGSGIPPEAMEKIFQPLFTTKEEGRGTGLGLAICQDIIDRHRGNIDVESVVNKGTTFTIRLPKEA